MTGSAVARELSEDRQGYIFVYFPPTKTHFHCLLIYIALCDSVFFTEVIDNH